MTVTSEMVVDKLNKELFSLDFIVVDSCEALWNEQTITNVTTTRDTTDFVKGTSSAKFTIASGFTTGIIASKAISPSVDLRESTKLKLRLKSSISLSENVLSAVLSDSPQTRSILKTLNIPAMDPGIWYQHTLELIDPENPEDLVDICSVGLKANSDFGAAVINIDDIRGYNPNYGVSTSEVEKVITSATYALSTHLGLPDSDDLPLTGDYGTLLEEAISYWAAGLLWNQEIAQKNPPSETYKQSKTEGDSLINTAKDLLKPF